MAVPTKILPQRTKIFILIRISASWRHRRKNTQTAIFWSAPKIVHTTIFEGNGSKCLFVWKQISKSGLQFGHLFLKANIRICRKIEIFPLSFFHGFLELFLRVFSFWIFFPDGQTVSLTSVRICFPFQTRATFGPWARWLNMSARAEDTPSTMQTRSATKTAPSSAMTTSSLTTTQQTSTRSRSPAQRRATGWQV